jgi:hypothetical protein
MENTHARAHARTHTYTHIHLDYIYMYKLIYERRGNVPVTQYMQCICNAIFRHGRASIVAVEEQ